jgi:Fic family protein
MENGWTKRIEELEAEVAKLTAERDADRRREYGYSQQTVDALTAERDSLKHLYDKALGDLVKDSQRISELEDENTRLRMLRDAAESRAQGLEEENKRLMEQYNSLIFEVSYKFPGESRHDTAKRYIREREEHGIEIVDKQALKKASHD